MIGPMDFANHLRVNHDRRRIELHVQRLGSTALRHPLGWVRAFLTGTLLLGLACGDGGAGPEPPPKPPGPVPTRIELSQTSVMLAAIGATAQVSATVFDQNGQQVQVTVSWSSSDEAVAVVDGSGLVTARGNGSAAVTATVAKVFASASLTVLQETAEFRVEWGEPRVLLGDSLRVTIPVATDANGQPIDPSLIKWHSSDSSVLTVATDGWLRTIAEGSARVTVEIADTVAHQDYSVELDGGSLTLNVIPPGAVSDAGALLEIGGPGIDSLRAASGYELFESGTGGAQRQSR